jgi:zinc D-Ala-D-Ala dipeptidase
MKKLFFLLTLSSFTFPQKDKKSSPPKPVQICPYEEKMRKQGLVDVQDLDPSIQVELKYSTTDNFVGKDIYDCIERCFMQRRPAEMLVKAQQILKQKNPDYSLLVYDGGRPLAIQKILWNTLTKYPPKEREKYVSNPAEGSIHNYGSAVDLTIADANGLPLDMGTKYDFFGELAYPAKESYFLKKGQLTKVQISNRQLLRSVMKAAGYSPIEYEWWHFNAISRQKAKAIYRIID